MLGGCAKEKPLRIAKESLWGWDRKVENDRVWIHYWRTYQYADGSYSGKRYEKWIRGPRVIHYPEYKSEDKSEDKTYKLGFYDGFKEGKNCR